MLRFASFVLVGAVGFGVDGGLLVALIPLLGHYAARLVSFPVAVVVTFVLNRTLTFRDRRGDRPVLELIRYVGGQMLGAGVNLVVYAVLVWSSETMRSMPIIAFAFGSAAGLVVNYANARFVVFRTPAPAPPGASDPNRLR